LDKTVDTVLPIFGGRIMPCLFNRNPSYRKHRASGQAIVTLNGQDHCLGPYNRSGVLTEAEHEES
jgi:hypothetical protein